MLENPAPADRAYRRYDMRTFFIEIALVESAAELLGRSLTENYAVLGSLSRYAKNELKEICAVEGMEDLVCRAESFRFGMYCGQILRPYTDELTEAQRQICEARTARLFWANGIDTVLQQDAEKVTAAMKVLLESLVKRAQIRTHTAKPGSEDINLWLNRYNQMQKEYHANLDHFARMIVMPTEEETKIGEAFIHEKDPAVRAAVMGDRRAFAEALSEPASCSFGEALREVWRKCK